MSLPSARVDEQINAWWELHRAKCLGMNRDSPRPWCDRLDLYDPPMVALSPHPSSHARRVAFELHQTVVSGILVGFAARRHGKGGMNEFLDGAALAQHELA